MAQSSASRRLSGAPRAPSVPQNQQPTERPISVTPSAPANDNARSAFTPTPANDNARAVEFQKRRQSRLLPTLPGVQEASEEQEGEYAQQEQMNAVSSTDEQNRAIQYQQTMAMREREWRYQQAMQDQAVNAEEEEEEQRKKQAQQQAKRKKQLIKWILYLTGAGIPVAFVLEHVELFDKQNKEQQTKQIIKVVALEIALFILPYFLMGLGIIIIIIAMAAAVAEFSPLLGNLVSSVLN